MDTDRRHQHHGHECGGGGGRQEAGRQEEAGHGLSESRLGGVHPARPETQLLQELAGARNAVAAKPAEQLLRAVCGQGQPYHQTQDQ